MTYEETITRIAERNDLPKADVKRICESLVDVIHENALMGLRIPGLGTFKQVHKAARTCRNPATGEPVAVPAKDVLKFKPSK